MSNLPYDAEIEYIESTGTQYIDTNYTPVIGDSIHIEFMQDRAIVSTTDYQCLYSAGTGTYQIIHLIGKTNVLDGAYYKYFATGQAEYFNYYPSVGVWYTLDVTGNGIATIGNYTSTSNPIDELDGNDTTLWLFIRINGATPFIGKIKRFWIENGGVKKLDYIPVRVGQVGYLYDKVSGELFGNAGTDDFVLGDDRALPNPFGFRRRLMMVGGGEPLPISNGLIAWLDGNDINSGDTNWTCSANIQTIYPSFNVQFSTTNTQLVAGSNMRINGYKGGAHMQQSNSVPTCENPLYVANLSESDNVTYEIVANLDVNSEWEYLCGGTFIGSGIYASNGKYRWYAYFSNDTLGWNIQNGSLWVLAVSLQNNIRDASPHHVAFVKSANDYFIYIDGVLSAQNTASLGIPAVRWGGLIGIGRYDGLNNTTGRASAGNYYCFSIYNRALSAAEILQNKQAYFKRYNLT